MSWNRVEEYTKKKTAAAAAAAIVTAIAVAIATATVLWTYKKEHYSQYMRLDCYIIHDYMNATITKTV